MIRARLKHYAKRMLNRPSVPPPIKGVADAQWYDANYRVSANYAAPYWESEYLFLWSVLADRIRTARARHVLDIGCGAGQFASCLYALAPIEGYTGLDFSAQAVAMAQRTCPQARFVVGDATKTTVHDEVPHDILTCTEVLEHVPADHLVIERFKPGTRCICTVPNFPHETHVRHFTTVEQVADRYGRFFDDLDVWALRRSPSQVFFVLDGTRNHDRS
jgi:2-polyprenyl-3-methyl-5-hydroxy-6-metoxy-1,4-benzoquinol methylase